MKKAGLVLFLVLTFFCASFVGAVTINVPGNYSTIQDAIDNASSGDVINVSAGNYNENAIVNGKTNIIIQGNNAALVPATGIGFAISDSDKITIKEFQINTTGLNAHGIWIGGTPNGYGNSNDLFFEDNVINIGGKSSGIYAEQVNAPHSSWEITGNEINAPNLGVNLELYDVDDVLIDNNLFGQSGSVSLVYSSENSNVGEATISNNEFKGNGNIGGVTPMIWIESDFISGDGNSNVNKVTIKENKFYNWVNYAIRIGEGNPNYDDVSNVVINYNGFYFGIGSAIENDISNKIIDGRYNWWGSCNGPGPIGPGSGAGVSINVSYTPWLGICITNKTDVTCAFETKDVTLSANVSGEEIDSVWFSYIINGTNHNKTASYVGGNRYQITISSSELVGGQNVTWNVYANDSLNVYSNSWKTFYVRSKTKLSVNPSTPDGKNGWYLQNPFFELINDDSAGNSYYQWDSTGKILYTGIFSTENAPNNQNVTGGIVELNWLSDLGSDSGVLCGNETEQNQIFFIDLTNPLIKDINPKNNEVVYGLNTEISAYLEDKYQSNSGINASSVVMKINGVKVSPNIILVNSSKLDFDISYIFSLNEGWNNVSIYVEDLAGKNSSLTWSFLVISTEPEFNLSIYSPKDLIYNNKRVQFNISTIEEVENIEYINDNDRDVRWRNLCKNCNEYGFSKKLLKPLNEGENRIIIRATDSIENQQNKSVSLIVETKEPLILKTYPRANSYTNGSEFYIKYTEENLNKIELFWNGSKELNCSKGSNQECITFADLSSHNGEQIEYWFKITDIMNNTKESKKTKIKVDTKSPVINSIKYEIDFNRKKIELTINATEDNLDKIQYRDLNQSNSKFNTVCRKLKEGICEKTVSFKGDIPNIQILALDKAGNSDVKATP